MRRFTVALLTLSFLSLALPLQAADQAVLGKLLLVKNPSTPDKRKVVMKAMEPASGASIVGDPSVDGAALVIDAIGGSTNSETYDLPAGVSAATGKPFWQGDATKGFKYKDRAGENGPVKVAQIKKTGGGMFRVKAVISGKLGAVSLQPPDQGTRGCALLTIGGGGDSYSIRFADGDMKSDGAKQYKVKDPATAGTCINCDPLDGNDCLFPFPSDWFTIDDPSTDSGRRVNFSRAVMPRNVGGVAMDFAPYNDSDGFSPGASILLRVPGVDLAMTGAAPITDVERSLDVGAPVVVVNATTLAHHLMWVELDANATSELSRALIIRPAVNFDEATRYIVALRQMKDGNGAVIPPSADFLAYRDNTPTGDPVKESRRAHMEDVFTTLAAAGVPRNDLYLAWDFTVASARNITERLLFMRDDGFSRLGANAPAFTVTMVEDELDSRVFRRVTGTFEVERYVDSTLPGARFQLDPGGLPLHQATPQVAAFQCIIPRAVLANAAASADAGRASIYGHGLLGSHTQVASGPVRDMANEHGFVFCGTKWIGMADEDVPNAVEILQELGKFPSFTDRLQQAMLNQLFLARLMIHAQGFVSHPAFQDAFGEGVIDLDDVFYDGNSQGGIFGGTVMAISQDITRGVLGVPGMNYSLLLTRSVDFDAYKLFYYPAYPNELQRPLGLALIQMLWDRSEPNGYAHHMTDDPLPNTPPHKVLLHVAFGDHQVANVATEIQARTIGASIHQPAIAAGRHSDVDPYFDIPAIPTDPFDGSALIIWDSGAATPPITNTAPSTGADPHSDPRNSVDGRSQKNDFLDTNGKVEDVCSGLPCMAP
jgi:hypothetical protein